MTKLLLIHNSDLLFETLKPPDDRRPLFYWYSDRFVHHMGTQQYLYLFLVNPKEDGIELRARAGNLDFDSLHKGFLRYKDFCEGQSNNMYEESGIAMSFSELKPAITLMARSLGSAKEDHLQTKYEIITPMEPFSKRLIELFEGPYTDESDRKPIRFADIPELVELAPDIKNSLPTIDLSPDDEDIYHYEDWIPVTTHKQGTWL